MSHVSSSWQVSTGSSGSVTSTSLLHNGASFAVDFAVLVDSRHELVVRLFVLNFLWEPLLQEVGEFEVQIFYDAVSLVTSSYTAQVCTYQSWRL